MVIEVQFHSSKNLIPVSQGTYVVQLLCIAECFVLTILEMSIKVAPDIEALLGVKTVS